MAEDDKAPKAEAEAAKEESAEAPKAETEAAKEESAEAPKAEAEAAKEESVEAPKAEAKAEAPAPEVAAAPKTEEAPAAAEAPKADEEGGESRTITDLADLGTPSEADDPGSLPEPKIDAQGRSYATGKRKDAVARVWIKPGSGQIIVNNRPVDTYFARPVLRMIIGQPFAVAARIDHYDVKCTVKGGGLSGQAGAVRHGISKALTLYEPELRKPLKSGGFLTRDSRVVERKKYGRHKARRSHQFSKR